ncbi:MAG: hypothetical protein ABJB49_02355 [Nitrospirota bacterium]
MKKLIGLAVLICFACSGAESGKGGSAKADTSAAPQSASDQNTCSAIAASELADALGGPVTRQESPTSKRCVYYTSNPVVYADIEIDRESGEESWKGVNAGDSLIGAQQDSLAGIGDMAFFGPRDRLYVKKGNTFIAIEAGFDDKVRERARKIARVVAPKL